MNKIFRLFAGFVLLISSLLKATATNTFADLMGQYGAEWFGFGAPVLILVETILGIMLIFNIYPRFMAFASSIFIFTLSAIFLYGVLNRGITNCGCFGPLTWLNSKPGLTFTRNAILLAMLIPSALSSQQGSATTMPTLTCMALVGIVVMFMCGFSFRGAKCLKKQHQFRPVVFAESKLSEYVTCNPDSTYLVFAFSYSCPFCQNSIGNVNQYQQMEYVDKVIGLAVEDSNSRCRFERLFETNFEIEEMSQIEMFNLTTTLPTTYLVRHDSIISQYSGMVISPALLIP